jgi:signal transduction histidine kinase
MEYQFLHLQNRMKKAILYLCLCCNIVSAVDCYAQSLDTILHQANRLYQQNNYTSAQEKYLQVLKQAEAEINYPAMVRSSISLARCHYFLYDHSASLKWSYNAMYIAQKHQIDSLLSEAYYFLGILYIEAGKVDSAEKYSYKTIELAKKENDYTRVSQTYSTLAELHLNTSKNPESIEHMISNAEKYAGLSGDKAMIAFANSKNYNYAFFLKKDYQQALTYINKAEKLYLETGNREAILNAYRAKAECLIMLRDTAARSYMLQWFNFKDSILQLEKAANVVRYETLFETEKKEVENKLLLEENKLTRLAIQSKNRALIIIIILFLLILLIGLLLISKNNLKKKHRELLLIQNLQRDKERIARDLHDNVGGQLSYIIYSLDGINDKDKEKRTQLTESIDQAIRTVIGSLRETIWAISYANITVVDFSDKLKVFVRTLFKHSQTQINFTENIKSEISLNALLGLNLYRICQEILNNAFKYAKATEVNIQLNSDEQKLCILISDNGIGFDTSQQKQEGYGLQNIRNRAAEFGISLTLEAGINKGTRYTLIV